MVSELPSPNAEEAERSKLPFAMIAAAAARATIRHEASQAPDSVTDSTDLPSVNEAFCEELLDYMSRHGGRINIAEIIRKFIGIESLSDDGFKGLTEYLATLEEIKHTRKGWYVIVDHEAYLSAHPRPPKQKETLPPNHDLDERLRSFNMGPRKPRIVASLNNTTARRGGSRNW